MRRLSKDEIERSFDDEVDPDLEREIEDVCRTMDREMGRTPSTYRNGCPILSDEVSECN